MDGAAEVELLPCDYAARYVRVGCRQYRATTIVRYVDHQGRPLKQLEVCGEACRPDCQARAAGRSGRA